jgi:hypothetical protein
METIRVLERGLPISPEPGPARPGTSITTAIRISEGTASGPIHIAFAAPDRAAADAFHREALVAGGRDNGGPGNNAEAVTHRPE